MREILFRGQTRRKGEKVYMNSKPVDSNWVYGGVFPNNNGGDFAIIYQQEPEIKKFTVYADTVGQYTGMTEFVMTDKSFNEKLFEGDIVEVWGWRRPKYDNPRSQYDGDYKVRAVIKWSRYKWILDYDNEYNKSLASLRGKEEFERVVDGRISLGDYGYSGSNEDWQREHNSHYKWHDIVKIGNIYDNPELLEEIK